MAKKKTGTKTKARAKTKTTIQSREFIKIEYSDRQMKVLKAAAEVFYEKSFHGTSMRDISRNLGIRQATLYHHFESKMVILEAICRIGMIDYLQNLENINNQDISSTEKIREAVYCHLEPFISHHFYVDAFVYLRRNLPKKIRKPLDDYARHYELLWEDLLIEGQEGNEISTDLDLYITVMGILGMLNTVVRWSTRKNAPELDKIAETFSKLILDGIRN